MPTFRCGRCMLGATVALMDPLADANHLRPLSVALRSPIARSWRWYRSRCGCLQSLHCRNKQRATAKPGNLSLHSVPSLEYRRTRWPIFAIKHRGWNQSGAQRRPPIALQLQLMNPAWPLGWGSAEDGNAGIEEAGTQGGHASKNSRPEISLTPDTNLWSRTLGP